MAGDLAHIVHLKETAQVKLVEVSESEHFVARGPVGAANDIHLASAQVAFDLSVCHEIFEETVQRPYERELRAGSQPVDVALFEIPLRSTLGHDFGDIPHISAAVVDLDSGHRIASVGQTHQVGTQVEERLTGARPHLERLRADIGKGAGDLAVYYQVQIDIGDVVQKVVQRTQIEMCLVERGVYPDAVRQALEIVETVKIEVGAGQLYVGDVVLEVQIGDVKPLVVILCPEREILQLHPAHLFPERNVENLQSGRFTVVKDILQVDVEVGDVNVVEVYLTGVLFAVYVFSVGIVVDHLEIAHLQVADAGFQIGQGEGLVGTVVFVHYGQVRGVEFPVVQRQPVDLVIALQNGQGRYRNRCFLAGQDGLAALFE